MNSDKQNNYTNSMTYEYFLARAYQFNASLKRPSNQEFLNLVEAENGNKHSWLPKFDKQLDEIKKRLSKAVTIFISKSKDSVQIEKLKDLQYEIDNIQSYQDIPEIVTLGSEITQSFRK